jgi:hypothetical protein
MNAFGVQVKQQNLPTRATTGFFLFFSFLKTLVICWCFSDPSLMGFSPTDDRVF